MNVFKNIIVEQVGGSTMNFAGPAGSFTVAEDGHLFIKHGGGTTAVYAPGGWYSVRGLG